MRKSSMVFVVLVIGVCAGGIGHAQAPTTFNQRINIANETASQIVVYLTRGGNNAIQQGSWTGEGCDVKEPGPGLYISARRHCSSNYPWMTSSSYQVCAVSSSQAGGNGPSGPWMNCTNALANGLTTIELGTGASSASGVNYDITMIPQRPGDDQMPCNDPQWSGQPYVASNTLTSTDPSNENYVQGGPFYYNQLKPGQIPGVTNQTTTTKTFCSGMRGVPYNFAARLSCDGRKTFTCEGKPTLGIGFPDKCGWKADEFAGNPSAHKNCSGNTSQCYQAFWWPMSQGGPQGPVAATGNGIYYGGYYNILQPQDNCSKASGPNPELDIRFGPGAVSTTAR